MEDRLNKKIEDGFAKIRELSTPPKTTKSLTEPTGDVEEQIFDYRVGVANWLTENLGKRDSLSEEYGKYFKNTEDAFTRKTDADKRISEFKLKEGAVLMETIGSVNPSCCIPEIWSNDVERTHVYPGSVFWGAWFLRIDRSIEGKPGSRVYICTVGPADCTTIATVCTEPTTTGATIECPYLDLVDDVCAYYMCKNDMETVVPDLIDELNAGLGDCLAKCIDNYMFDVLLNDTSCHAGSFITALPLSGSAIAETMGSMRSGTYEPVVLIVHPVAMSSLMQDTNFVYACRYGNRDVITGGRVLQWLNLEILMTPKSVLSIGGGSYLSLMLAKNAMAMSIKHGVRVESEYVVREQRNYVLATVKYGGTCLHPDGIWWIQSKDD